VKGGVIVAAKETLFRRKNDDSAGEGDAASAAERRGRDGARITADRLHARESCVGVVGDPAVAPLGETATGIISGIAPRSTQTEQSILLAGVITIAPCCIYFKRG